MILYPAGWGAERVQRICGPEADAFYLAECSLGSRNLKWERTKMKREASSTLSGPPLSLREKKNKKKGWKEMFYLPGWAFYSAVIGVGLTFICAVISGQAEKSTASDKVQDKMNEGKTLICLAWNEKNWGNCIYIVKNDAFFFFLKHPHRDFLCQKSDEGKCQIIFLPLGSVGRKNERNKKKKKKRKLIAGSNWGLSRIKVGDSSSRSY